MIVQNSALSNSSPLSCGEGARGRGALLLFSGWSASPHLFDRLQAEEGQDVWIVYDYRDLSFAADLSVYSRIDLLAWSMGVGVVEHLSHSGVFEKIAINSATAINGTPLPVHNIYGIPENIFKGTLDNLNEEGLRRFNKRMCGNRTLLAAYEEVTPRPLSEVRDELALLYERFAGQEEKQPTFAWDKAIVARNDLIFPTANQLLYWKDHVPVSPIEGGHYIFDSFSGWKEILAL
ncbi:DUF452 family protein [Parabacteroides sp. OttesenSCG-928-G06]|nr:DUF452 family protein [Parabacteroides sp. OttesenSCG-928-K15]MDL2282304.1 DUF452 family protein [Parabacteroides sp. OttesenSCG-928-G06]